MKKILYSVMAIAALTFSFASLTSCEDVPAPYEMPDVTPDNLQVRMWNRQVPVHRQIRTTWLLPSSILTMVVPRTRKSM